jgi:predicted membrane protein
MNNDIFPPNNPRNGKALAGIILLAVGAILLLQQFIIPDWVQLWPLWLIGWGFFIGARSNFHKPSSFVLLGLGIIFLFTSNIHNSERIFWPIAIIAFGLWMILRRHRHFDKDYWQKNYSEKWDWRSHSGVNPNDPAAAGQTSSDIPPAGPSMYPPSGDDYLDAVSVFGGVKKTILSKDFKGGDIVNVFGGAELDFTQADINGRVIIDITQIFGGTKIIVPSHWQVVSDIAAVFAGFDDKRIRNTATPNSDKILVLKGVSIFAGVDIRSF